MHCLCPSLILVRVPIKKSGVAAGFLLCALPLEHWCSINVCRTERLNASQPRAGSQGLSPLPFCSSSHLDSSPAELSGSEPGSGRLRVHSQLRLSDCVALGWALAQSLNRPWCQLHRVTQGLVSVKPQPTQYPWAELEAVALGVSKEESWSVAGSGHLLFLVLPCACCGSLDKHFKLSTPGLTV